MGLIITWASRTAMHSARPRTPPLEGVLPLTWLKQLTNHAEVFIGWYIATACCLVRVASLLLVCFLGLTQLGFLVECCSFVRERHAVTDCVDALMP